MYKKDYSFAKFTQPEYWQEFEDMCKDLLNLEYTNPIRKAEKNTSVPQHGVDVFKSLPNGDVIGLQCKKRKIDNKTPLSISEIEEEIEEAKKFKPQLKHFIIATSIKVDSKTKEFVREKDQEQQKSGLFSIELWEPEKLNDLINGYDGIVKKYFPELLIERGVSVQFVVDELFKEIKNPELLLEKTKKVIDDSWEKTDNNGKAKLLTQLAVAHFEMGDFIKAAMSIIDAYEYDKNNENILSNMVTAYYLLKDNEKTQEFVKKTLEKNPLNANANNMQLRAKIKDAKNLEEFVKDINDELFEDIRIAISIAVFCLERQDTKNALFYLEKARNSYKNEKNKSTKLQFLLTELEIRRVGTLYYNRLDKTNDSVELKAIKENLLSIWNSLESNAEKRAYIDCCFGIIEVMLTLDESSSVNALIDEIQLLDSNNPSVVHRVSLIYYGVNKIKETISFLEQKKEYLNDESIITLFFAYAKNGDFEKSFILSDKVVNSTKQPFVELIVLFDTIKIYLQHKKDDLLDKILDIVKKKFALLFLIAKYESDKIKGNKNEQYLLQAKDLIDVNTHRVYLIYLAETLCQAKRYIEAKAIFDSYIDLSVFSDDVYYYALCLANVNSVAEAVRLLESFDIKKLNIYAINYLYQYYYKIYDLRKIKELLEPNLERLQISYKLEYFKIKMYLNEFDGIETEMKSINADSLSNSDLSTLAGLLVTINEDYAIEILYSRILQGKADAKIEADFFGYATLRKKYFPKLIVDYNCAVIVESSDGNKMEVFIEDKNCLTPIVNLYKTSHPLVNNVMNKKVGDEFEYQSNEYTAAEKYKLISIIPKHPFLAIKLMKDYDLRYPGNNQMQTIKIDDKDIVKSLAATREVMLKRNEHTKAILEFNEKGVFTIESLASLLKHDIFDTYDTQQAQSILCSFGNDGEKNDLSVFGSKKEVIIDIISLFNVFKLNLHSYLKLSFDKIYILKRAVYLELFNAVNIALESRSEGRLVFHKDIETPILVNNDKDLEKSKAQEMKRFQEWVEENCVMISSKGISNYKQDQIDEQVKLFGINTAHMFMEASNQDSLVVYCDDVVARKFCLPDKVAQKTFILPFIEYLSQNSLISNQEESKIRLSLIKRKYKQIPIRANDIVFAYIQQDDNFDLVCKEIPENIKEQQLTNIVYSVIRGILKEGQLISDFQQFIDTLLQNYEQQIRDRIIVILIKELRNKQDKDIFDWNMTSFIHDYKLKVLKHKFIF